jgi:hypothetical protein
LTKNESWSKLHISTSPIIQDLSLGMRGVSLLITGNHWHWVHWSTDNTGTPTFTGTDLSNMSVNIGVPVSSVLHWIHCRWFQCRQCFTEFTVGVPVSSVLHWIHCRWFQCQFFSIYTDTAHPYLSLTPWGICMFLWPRISTNQVSWGSIFVQSHTFDPRISPIMNVSLTPWVIGMFFWPPDIDQSYFLRVYLRPIAYFWPLDFDLYECSFDPMSHRYVLLTSGYRPIGFLESLTSTNQVFLTPGFRPIGFLEDLASTNQGFWPSDFDR